MRMLLAVLTTGLYFADSADMKLGPFLSFGLPINSLSPAFDWGASSTCKNCAYATSSTASGANPMLIAIDLPNMKVMTKVPLSTPECPNFKAVGAARLTLDSDVEDTVYVAQANSNVTDSPDCTGRVLTVSQKKATVTGSLNTQFPNRFDGANFHDITYTEDEVQIVGARYLYGWCPLCSPTVFSVADFGCGPLMWGVPDQFVADGGEPNGGMLSFKSGLLAEVEFGHAAIPTSPSWGRPNTSVAVGDCCYFTTAVAAFTYEEITPPWPPIYEYYSAFFLANSRDPFTTKTITMGRNTSTPPFDQYMFGPKSKGILDITENDGSAYWLAYKTKGTKGDGPAVLIRVDFTYPTFQFGSALELPPQVVSVNSIVKLVNDPLHVYLACEMADGTGQVIQVITGVKSRASSQVRVPRKFPRSNITTTKKPKHTFDF